MIAHRLIHHTILSACLLTAAPLAGQQPGLYQTDFPPSEFQERRAKVFDQIGDRAIALIQGAPAGEGFELFRQSNEIYYLCGLETPHSYLLLDGRTRKTILYLPHRDEGLERQSGKLLSAEDAPLAAKLTGADEVHGVEALARYLARAQIRLPAPVLYTPFSPSESTAQSRDELLRFRAAVASDPWDGRPSRPGQLLALLRSRFPSFEPRDLSPILDEMRLVKSPREITLIRRASRIAGLAIMEAMRSTKPGVFEYQLDAAARYVFLVNGARHEGYPSITAGGTNAWMGHYFRNTSRLQDGDLVLMDYAPDYHYYTSDITRMWPVNGSYTKGQKALCGFILAYREALLERIRPGRTADQILDGAREVMEAVWRSTEFPKEAYRKAAREALDFRGHLSHPVGMTVHDVGNYRRSPLKAGTVFSVDPMLWVPEEKLYVRMEDVVVVTETGVENFTDFLPARLEEIEELIQEEGIVQLRPPMDR
ncbi:MAG: aminopeptidase P family protein [bacterium]|nr:aminopeptidase P family protein [bacterium]